MTPQQRVVISLPLRELWDERGQVSTARGAMLDADEIVARLQDGTVRFVVANPGLPLGWIPPEQTFMFWKTEVRPRLGAKHAARAPSDLPGGYGYIATLWALPDSDVQIVLLEMFH
jgi:hypothetical protein